MVDVEELSSNIKSNNVAIKVELSGNYELLITFGVFGDSQNKFGISVAFLSNHLMIQDLSLTKTIPPQYFQSPLFNHGNGPLVGILSLLQTGSKSQVFCNDRAVFPLEYFSQFSVALQSYIEYILCSLDLSLSPSATSITMDLESFRIAFISNQVKFAFFFCLDKPISVKVGRADTNAPLKAFADVINHLLPMVTQH